MSTSMTDWQLRLDEIKARTKYLLQTGLMSDCEFLVGVDPQVTVPAHKLLLVMSSPVFEAMFCGGLACGNNPILIPDIQPDAFKFILEYLYTDTLTINSFNDACDIYYAAKKYMLPFVVMRCVAYIKADLNLQNVCQTFELATLFDDKVLLAESLKVIQANTKELINDKHFEDFHIDTIVAVLALDHLNIENELDLFHFVERYAGLDNTSLTGPACVAAEFADSAPLKSQDCIELNNNSLTDQKNQDIIGKDIRKAIKQIRFLNLSLEQFARGPARSKLLTRGEALAALVNIASPGAAAMPSGLSLSRVPRCKEANKSEGAFEYQIFNAKGRTRPVETGQCLLQELLWKMQMKPGEELDTRVPTGGQLQKRKTLGLYIKCDGSKFLASWSCRAEVTFRVLAQKPKARNHTIKFNHVFTYNSDEHGISNVMWWEELCDPNRGFLKRNTIIIEAHIVADAPRLCTL